MHHLYSLRSHQPANHEIHFIVIVRVITCHYPRHFDCTSSYSEQGLTSAAGIVLFWLVIQVEASVARYRRDDEIAASVATYQRDTEDKASVATYRRDEEIAASVQIYERDTEDEVLISSSQITTNVCWPTRQDTGSVVYMRNEVLSSHNERLLTCETGHWLSCLYEKHWRQGTSLISQTIANMRDRTPVWLFIRERLKTRHFFPISCNECLLIYGAGHWCSLLLRIMDASSVSSKLYVAKYPLWPGIYRRFSMSKLSKKSLKLFFSINFLSTMIFHFELVSPQNRNWCILQALWSRYSYMKRLYLLQRFLREVPLKASRLVYNASHCTKIHREVGLREVWSKPTNHIIFRGHTSENLSYTSAVPDEPQIWIFL